MARPKKAENSVEKDTVKTKLVGITEVRQEVPTFMLNGVEFIDISTEQYRTYVFADGRELTIYDPRGINISASRGHRIVTKDGWAVYVKPAEGWYLHWRMYPGNEPFNF